MTVTTIDGVNKIQIRNAKNGDFDLNLAGGGGGGGSSNPLFPTITIESTFDESFNIISTDIDIEQGMRIDNLNVVEHFVQPSSGMEATQTNFCGVVRVYQWDDETNSPIYRYLFSSNVDSGTVYELSINEETNEILSVEAVDIEIDLVASQSESCYENMVYKITFNVFLYEDGVLQSGYRYLPLPLSIAVLRCPSMQREYYRIELATDSYSSNNVYITVFQSGAGYRTISSGDLIGRLDNIPVYVQ